MRILFFSTTPPNFSNLKGTYNGGGWIGTLIGELSRLPSNNVAVAFISRETSSSSSEDHSDVQYFPINVSRNLFERIVNYLLPGRQESRMLKKFMDAINDFNPDIIQVFGLAESPLGLVCEKTSIPVCIHIQGMINPCLNAWVPPFYTMRDYIRNRGLSPLSLIQGYLAYRYNMHAARAERQILSKCKYLLGRTNWDKAYCSLYAPQATYFHCKEMLRDLFLDTLPRSIPERPRFVSILSTPLYKGHDLVLKTAKVLIDAGIKSFEWLIFGVSSIHTAERKTKIRADEVNVRCMGIATAEQIKESLSTCTLYIHPSYIENSPNSICEAQICSVPTIACNVGGVSSLVEDKITGILVPANDPYSLASSIRDLLSNKEKAAELGHQGQVAAMNRHDRKTIINDIMTIYASILSLEKAQAPIGFPAIVSPSCVQSGSSNTAHQEVDSK